MIPRISFPSLLVVFCCSFLLTQHRCYGFATTLPTTKKSTLPSSSFYMAFYGSRGQQRTFVTGAASPVNDDVPTECFIVNQEAVVTEGETPEIVCTNAPEEYAWFNGIEKDKLIPTDGTSEENLECVEKASPRGIPEWECHGSEQEQQ